MNFDAKQYWRERSKPCPYQDNQKICYTGEGTACKGCKPYPVLTKTIKRYAIRERVRLARVASGIKKKTIIGLMQRG